MALAEPLNNAARSLIEAQSRAVDDVKDEANKYAHLETPRSLWWDIAELALVMGTAGIAASIAKLGAQKLLSVFEQESEPLLKTTEAAASRSLGHAASSAHEETLAAEGIVFDSISRSADGQVAAHTAKAGAQYAAHEGESLVGEGIATALEDGLKHPVEKALEGFGEGGGEDEAKDGGEAGANSADGDINFFSAQQDVLSEAKEYASLFALHLRSALHPMLVANPVAAATAAAHLEKHLKGAKSVAKHEQAASTAVQFVTYRARATLGVDRRGGGEVTRMDAARHFENLTAPNQVQGLLDIMIEVEQGSVRVTGARMNGVSQLIADRLLGRELASAHMPVRFVVGRDSGFITRDEAGRVRASGFVHFDPDGSAGFDEAQELRGAERIAKLVLAKPLAEWGVGRVETDDANGKERR